MSDRSLGKVYQDGQCIIQQGETGDCMYVIQQGEVEVIQQEGDHQVQLRVLHQGDVFGEMAIFEREVRSASVRALGSVQVLTIDKRTFLRRVKEDPTLAFNILQLMSQRIRKLNADVMRLQRTSSSPQQ